MSKSRTKISDEAFERVATGLVEALERGTEAWPLPEPPRSAPCAAREFQPTGQLGRRLVHVVDPLFVLVMLVTRCGTACLDGRAAAAA